MKLKGILHTDVDGKSFIRQYTVDGEFVDYAIYHDDLSIIIDDNSAKIGQLSNGEYFIDYTDEVLGR